MPELLEAAVYVWALQESESRSAWSLHGASAPGGGQTPTLLSKNSLQTEGEARTERFIRSHDPQKNKNKKETIWLFFLENQFMEVVPRAAIGHKQVDHSLAFESTDSIKINKSLQLFKD